MLYVSHRLDEIFELADRVTVLRGGRVIATQPSPTSTPRGLASLMVGEDVDPDYRAPVASRPDAPVVLEARDIRGRWLRGVDLDVHRGEILGIAGLAGVGVLELPYALAGCAQHAVSGRIRLAGAVAPNGATSPTRRDLGIPLVPADRGARGRSSRSSPSARTCRCPCSGASAGADARQARRGGARRAVDASVWASSTAGPEAPISTLSGGNQQKVVVARCLVRDPALLVLCEPTAGVDIGTRVAIYDLIAELSRNGLTVVVVVLRRRRPARDVHARRRPAGRPYRRRDRRRGTHRARARKRDGGRRSMTLTSVPEAVTEPAARAQAAPARTGPSRAKRLAHGLAFDRIGAVYVWLGIIVLFSLWVPETFPNLATAKQILNANAITGAGRAVDHDPARRAGLRPVVRGRR